jgi:hypothetical protein
MKLQINKILKTLSQGRTSPLGETIREALVLEEKLSGMDNQSFYFRKASKNLSEKLEGQKDHIQELIEFYNSMTYDQALNQLEEAKGRKKGYDQKAGTPFRIASGMMKNQILLLEDALYWKSILGDAFTLEDILSDERVLSKVFS